MRHIVTHVQKRDEKREEFALDALSGNWDVVVGQVMKIVPSMKNDDAQIVRWQKMRAELTILIRLQRHSRSFDNLGRHAVNAARARDDQIKKIREMADKL